MSIFVFFLFGLMFFKMSRKHTKRILGYEDYRPFWHFFDVKAYLLYHTLVEKEQYEV